MEQYSKERNDYIREILRRTEAAGGPHPEDFWLAVQRRESDTRHHSRGSNIWESEAPVSDKIGYLEAYARWYMLGHKPAPQSKAMMLPRPPGDPEWPLMLAHPQAQKAIGKVKPGDLPKIQSLAVRFAEGYGKVQSPGVLVDTVLLDPARKLVVSTDARKLIAIPYEPVNQTEPLLIRMKDMALVGQAYPDYLSVVSHFEAKNQHTLRLDCKPAYLLTNHFKQVWAHIDTIEPATVELGPVEGEYTRYPAASLALAFHTFLRMGVPHVTAYMGHKGKPGPVILRPLKGPAEMEGMLCLIMPVSPGEGFRVPAVRLTQECHLK